MAPPRPGSRLDYAQLGCCETAFLQQLVYPPPCQRATARRRPATSPSIILRHYSLRRRDRRRPRVEKTRPVYIYVDHDVFLNAYLSYLVRGTHPTTGAAPSAAAATMHNEPREAKQWSAAPHACSLQCSRAVVVTRAADCRK